MHRLLKKLQIERKNDWWYRILTDSSSSNYLLNLNFFFKYIFEYFKNILNIVSKWKTWFIIAVATSYIWTGISGNIHYCVCVKRKNFVIACVVVVSFKSISWLVTQHFLISYTGNCFCGWFVYCYSRHKWPVLLLTCVRSKRLIPD